MAKNVNDIKWRFLGDTKSLDRANKTAQKGFKKTSGVMDSVKKGALALGAAFGAREILQFGQDSITAASDYQESMNAVEVATGRASADIIALGETADTALGLSKTAVNEAAVAFAAFGEKIDAGDVGGVFEEYITRASDFASVMNLEVTDATSKFQSALAGEAEPLRKFGIDMSAAAVNAYAYANGIAEVGDTLTEAEKVQARYGQLLEETNEFTGDFANTSEDLAGSMKIANAQLENAKIELGKELMPLQAKWVAFQRSALIPALDNVTFAIGKQIDGYNALGQALEKADGKTLSLKESAVAAGNTLNANIPIVSGLVTAYHLLRGASDDAADAVAHVSKNTAEGDDALIGYGRNASGAADDLNALADAAGGAESKLKSLDDLVRIFTGDLFDLGEATRRANVNALFAGGGGSGQVADPGAVIDAQTRYSQTNGLP